MRFWTLLLVGVGGCATKEEDTGGGAGDDPPFVDTAPPTDTGGGVDEPFVPGFANIDAHFGVDASGQVVGVFDEAYAYTIEPYIVLYVGSQQWEGDFADEDNLCIMEVDIRGATPGGAWVAERGLWYGFDSPPNAPTLYSSCTDMVDAGYDPYELAAELLWMVGVGPLTPPWTEYSATDLTLFGGYTASPVDPEPDDDEALNAYAYAYAVDPATMTLAFTYEGDYIYYTEVDAATIPLEGGGVTPAYYNVVSYFILELP